MECSLPLSLSRFGPTLGIPGVPYFPNMVQEFFDLIPPSPRPHLYFFHQSLVFKTECMLHRCSQTFIFASQVKGKLCKAQLSCMEHNYMSASPPSSIRLPLPTTLSRQICHVNPFGYKTMGRKCFLCTRHIF